MAEMYITKYGELLLDSKIDMGEYYWECDYRFQSAVYQKEITITVAVFSENKQISDDILRFSEEIVQKADEYLQKAFDFMKKSFENDPKAYKITQKDLEILQKPMSEIVWCPAFSFYDNDLEWILRFDEGKLSICEPYGIAIFFNKHEISFIDTLYDAEELDDYTKF